MKANYAWLGISKVRATRGSSTSHPRDHSEMYASHTVCGGVGRARYPSAVDMRYNHMLSVPASVGPLGLLQLNHSKTLENKHVRLTGRIDDS